MLSWPRGASAYVCCLKTGGPARKSTTSRRVCSSTSTTTKLKHFQELSTRSFGRIAHRALLKSAAPQNTISLREKLLNERTRRVLRAAVLRLVRTSAMSELLNAFCAPRPCLCRVTTRRHRSCRQRQTEDQGSAPDNLQISRSRARTCSINSALACRPGDSPGRHLVLAYASLRDLHQRSAARRCQRQTHMPRAPETSPGC